MADPVGIIISCIKVVDAINTMYEDARKNGEDMISLIGAVAELADPLDLLKDTQFPPSNSSMFQAKLIALDSLLNLLEEIRTFVANNGVQHFLYKMKDAHGTKKKIKEYFVKLHQTTARLHFSVSVHERKRNEERDEVMREMAKQNNPESCYIRYPPQVDTNDDRSELGKGVFGNTHKVLNSVDKQFYALKIVNIKQATLNGCPLPKLLAEATLLQSIGHPNIVRYITSFKSQQDKYFNIIMELAEGGSLIDKITVEPPVAHLQIVAWLRETASALVYLHDAIQVLHRDIKPDNILLTAGPKPVIKIIDLGLACVAQSSGAATMSMAGCITYFSYEKANQIAYDGRDDVWAAGLVFAELLTRSRIHERGGAMYLYTNQEVRKRHTRLLQDCDAASPEITRILRKVLVHNVRERIDASGLLSKATRLHASLKLASEGKCGIKAGSGSTPPQASASDTVGLADGARPSAPLAGSGSAPATIATGSNLNSRYPLDAEGCSIGIDLGTCYTCAAICCDDKTEIILNLNGNRTTPSSVTFTSEGRYLGDESRNRSIMEVANTVHGYKRLIGHRLDDSTVQHTAKYMAYKLSADVNGKPLVNVTHIGESKQLTPVEVSSMLLSYIKRCAVRHSSAVMNAVGSSRVDLQACKLEYSIVSPK